MSLLTLTELKDHIETDLPDDALQIVLDNADAEVIRLGGDHALPRVQTFRIGDIAPNGSSRIELRWAADLVTAVTEDGDNVAESDYHLELNGRMLVRDNKLWSPPVVASYQRVDDISQRKMVIIDAVRLHLDYSLSQMTSIGNDEYQIQYRMYHEERLAIFGRMTEITGGSLVV